MCLEAPPPVGQLESAASTGDSNVLAALSPSFGGTVISCGLQSAGASQRSAPTTSIAASERGIGLAALGSRRLVCQHFLVSGPFALSRGRFNVEVTSRIGRMREGRRGLQTTGSVTIQPDLRGGVGKSGEATGPRETRGRGKADHRRRDGVGACRLHTCARIPSKSPSRRSSLRTRTLPGCRLSRGKQSDVSGERFSGWHPARFADGILS